MNREKRINILLDAHSRWKKLRKANGGKTPEFLPPDLQYIQWVFEVENRRARFDRDGEWKYWIDRIMTEYFNKTSIFGR